MGDTIKKIEEVLSFEKPNAVMILGDTNSSVAAIAAERMHIPVYHMEAGNRSFDPNVPEELNRKMVDHVASFNLPYNSYSMRNLLSEGVHPRRICVTGSPVREIFEYYKDQVFGSKILESLNLEKGGYFLVSVHRQENVDQEADLKKVIGCLISIKDVWGLPVLVSTHPRTQRRLEEHGLLHVPGLIFHRPFGYHDYNKLQLDARCVISDSGTISEESSILNFPAVSLRESMERPEAMDAGAIILTGLDPSILLPAIDLAVKTKSTNVPDGYEVSNFSDVVLAFLFSTVMKHKKWAGIRTED
jgi:UDP-N-acetylglucosamine 2-epimerase (non-hydrolysing)